MFSSKHKWFKGLNFLQLAFQSILARFALLRVARRMVINFSAARYYKQEYCISCKSYISWLCMVSQSASRKQPRYHLKWKMGTMLYMHPVFIYSRIDQLPGSMKAFSTKSQQQQQQQRETKFLRFSVGYSAPRLNLRYGRYTAGWTVIRQNTPKLPQYPSKC